MGSEWPIVQLGDFVTHQKGFAFKSKDYIAQGRPIVRVSNFTDRSIDTSDLKFLSENDAGKYVDYELKSDDVVIATVGSWPANPASVVGKTIRVPDSCSKALLNQNSVRLRAKPGLHQHFLFFLLKTMEYQNYIVSKAQGSANQASITLKDIFGFEFALPDEREQLAIVGMLGSLDNKIALNRQINTTLESMAQALFKSWFVDFDPVIDNALAAGNDIPEPLQARAERRKTLTPSPSPSRGRGEQAEIDASPLSPLPLEGEGLGEGKLPLKIQHLFPDSFVFTEDMGWVPEGWGIEPLDRIANYQNGLALQKFRPENDDDFLPVVKIAQLKKGYADGEEKASPNIKPECIIDDGDVVFSWSGSLVVDVWCGGKAALNQHLFKVTSDGYPKWFFLHYTMHHLAEFQRIAADKAVTMGHIKREHLSQAKCSVPHTDLIKKLSCFIESLLNKAVLNRLENRSLEDLRDSLLPKLLSGQLSIPEAEQALDEVV